MGAYAPIERPHTLQLGTPPPLLLELHRQSEGSSLFKSSWPQPCGGSPLWSPACPSYGRLFWNNEADFLSLRWVGGVEERLLEDDQVEAFDLGAQIAGRLGVMNFALDARIFSEFHDGDRFVSYDGEFVERSQEGNNSNFTFLSYARYRGNLSFDLGWGRIGWRRDAPHWGPSYHHATLFSRNSLPFDHLVYEGELGPLKVTSMMGDLVIDGWGRWTKIPESRTVYGHRYELTLHPNLLLGMSEQLILYKDRTLWGMVPVVPLFMLKGQLIEDNNNGNLAFDLQWRAVNGLRLYSEFLIDDVSEPTSLFNDYWKNRWAATLGAHAATTVMATPVGVIGEWTRIEPWVYTHYEKNTAQALHHGAPLGNPLGPDAMAVTVRGYMQLRNLYYSLMVDWSWKGSEEGSSVDDVRGPYDNSRKQFLKGVDRSEWTIAPEFLWSQRFWTVGGQLRWGRTKTEAQFRMSVGF